MHCDARYEKVVSYLLGRIVVVDEINEASGARRLGYHNKVVTAGRTGHQRGRQLYCGQYLEIGGPVYPQAGIEELKEKKSQSWQKQQTQAQEANDR